MCGWGSARMDRITNGNRRLGFENLETRHLLCFPFPTYPFGGQPLITNQFGDASYNVTSPDGTDLFMVRLGDPGTRATFSTSGSANTTLAYYGDESCPNIVDYDSGSGNNASITTNTPDDTVFEAGVVGLAVLTQDSTPYTVHVNADSPSSQALSISSTSRRGEETFEHSLNNGEAQWVRFTATHTGTWTVSARSDWGDLALSLFNAAGSALHSSSTGDPHEWIDNTYDGGTESHTLTLNASETVYLRIDPTGGFYQLQNVHVAVQGPSVLGTFPFTSPVVVPTDRFGDAYDVDGGSGVGRFIVLSNTAGSTSFYSSDAYAVEQVGVFTADGKPTEIVDTDPSDYQVEASTVQAANGPLGYAIAADSGYFFNVEGPDQSIETLTIDSTLLIGSAFSQALSTRYGVKWYEINLPTYSDWQFEVVPHNNLDVAITLFGESDSYPLVSMQDDRGPGQKEDYLLQGYEGTYFLRVDSQGRSAGMFDIKISGPNPFDYYFQNNNPLATRVHTNQHGNITLSGLGGSSATIEDFLIPSNASSGGTATFRTSGNPSVLALMNSDYSYVETYDDDNGTRVMPEIIETNYGFSTWNAAVAAEGPYSLVIDLPSQTVESLEIGANGKVEEEGYLDGPHDVRWYKFTANVSGEWDIILDEASGQDLSLLAFDADGNRLQAHPTDGTGGGGVENLTLSLTDGAEVYFRIDSASDGYYDQDDSGQFDLRVTSPRSTIQVMVDVLTAPFLIADALAASIDLTIDWNTVNAEQDSLQVYLVRLNDLGKAIGDGAFVEEYALRSSGSQAINNLSLTDPLDSFGNDINPETQYRIRFRALDPDQNPTLMGVSIDNVAIRSSQFLPTGDYSGDGLVGLDDYTIWRNTLGSDVDLRADGDANGIIDFNDYLSWKSTFGQGVEFDPVFQFSSTDVLPARWSTFGQGGTWSQQNGRMQFALDVSTSNVSQSAGLLVGVEDATGSPLKSASTTASFSSNDATASDPTETARENLLVQRIRPKRDDQRPSDSPLTKESESGDVVVASATSLDAALESLF